MILVFPHLWTWCTGTIFHNYNLDWDAIFTKFNVMMYNNFTHFIKQYTDLSSETGLHLPKGSVDKWDEVFCRVSLSGSPKMGGSRYFCTLWCTDIWLADEICQETASWQEQVVIWGKKTQTWWAPLEQLKTVKNYSTHVLNTMYCIKSLFK